MVFNEITKEAVLKALAKPRELDLNLVQAQETRRILDRPSTATPSRRCCGRKWAASPAAASSRSPSARRDARARAPRLPRRHLLGPHADLEKGAPFQARPSRRRRQTHRRGQRTRQGDRQAAAGKDLLLLDEAAARS